MIRLLIAPDAFKGSCDAPAVAAALARGAARAADRHGIELAVLQRPLSDGGEGFLEVVRSALGGERRVVRCAPVDTESAASPTLATWLWQIESRTAFGECARVVGPQLTRLSSPLGRTARGIADYLLAMREAGARRLILGVGGTSTVDGGASVAAGLGALFREGNGTIDVRDVRDAARATAVTLPATWHDVEVSCWCDVTTPLVGTAGAVPTFAPQKGASPEQVEILESALDTWVQRVAGCGGVHPTTPGTGAGGGIPFGVALCTGARIVPGAPAVIDLVGIPDALDRVDLVWTGEGRVDRTTSEGKLVSEVVRLAARKGRPIAVFGGQIDDTVGSSLRPAELIGLSGPEVPVERSLLEAEELLEEAAAVYLERWLRKTAAGET